MNSRHLRTLPLYFMIITANALPVYGAILGKLVFFQVIYLYWFESLLLIFFDCVRIAGAQGLHVGGGFFNSLQQAIAGGEHVGPGKKIGLMLQVIIVRIFLLLFYLLFIVVFVGFQVTGKSHQTDVISTMALRNQFFNTAVVIFLINMTVQLIGGFFLNGKYRTESPRSYATILDGRTLLMHVLIIGSVFIHKFIFADKAYVASGEVVYIGIFMVVRTVADIRHLRSRFAEQPDTLIPMI